MDDKTQNTEGTQGVLPSYSLPLTWTEHFSFKKVVLFIIKAPCKIDGVNQSPNHQNCWIMWYKAELRVPGPAVDGGQAVRGWLPTEGENTKNCPFSPHSTLDLLLSLQYLIKPVIFGLLPVVFGSDLDRLWPLGQRMGQAVLSATAPLP